MPDAYASSRAIVGDVAAILRPPRRVAVSRCAAESVRIETPGGYAGPWDAALTPYMIEPMDTLKSRRHEAVVFVSPARAGKTQALLDGWLAHCILADPGDMGLYFSTQHLAYDYRKRRVERMHRSSEVLRAMLSPRRHDTTIEMITYRHGMILNFGWPSSSQLAQRDLRYVAMSDYDSFPDDIGGEGSPFDLAKKRVQVAMSAGMALAESSPKRLITTNQWVADGPHMAPPVDGGILVLYNRGDRRRWYWACVDGCAARFEAPAMPLYDDSGSIEHAAQSAHVACPHCGTLYRSSDKPRLNATGRWQREGEPHEPRDSTIASFWLLGCAAAFQRWESIVANYLRAQREFDAGHDETALKATTNTDQGMPYLAKSLADGLGPKAIESRLERADRYIVPEGVRYLLATVDVQANRFEVLVIGHGLHSERWIIDRFAITETAAGISLQPPLYVEHWDELTSRVLNATYRLPSGREMRVYRTAIDSGGYVYRRKKADSTRRAYDWWRKLRGDGLGHRARLIKGGSARGAPYQRESFPDSTETRRRAGARGDVPLLLINTDRIKDVLIVDLQREVPGPGYVHLPDWLAKKHRDEIVSEQRTQRGWEPIGNRRNETWDLLVYDYALWLWVGGDKLREGREPPWARPWDSSTEVLSAEQRRTLKEPVQAGALPALGVFGGIDV